MNKDDKKEKREKIEDASGHALGQGVGKFNDFQNIHLNGKLDQYGQKIKSRLTRLDGGASEQSMATKQGNVFEEHHASSLEIEASSRGNANVTATTNVGDPNHPTTDIRVTTPDGTHDVQAKSYQDPKSTAQALSDPKYNKVDKLVPGDQVDGVKEHAQRQAQRNSEIRPEISESNQHTADNASATISTKNSDDIHSKPLDRKGENSAEELVKKAEDPDTNLRYKHEQEARDRLIATQYKNALKSGAMFGAGIAAGQEVMSFLFTKREVTYEECFEAASNIVSSAAKGSARAVATTGVQHVGKILMNETAIAAGKATATSATRVGGYLAKPGVAGAVVTLTVELAQNLYRYMKGEINSLEMGGNMVGCATQVAAGAAGFAVGTAAAGWIGAYVSTSVSGAAVLGTTWGTVGTVAMGMAGSIGLSLALTAYVGYFSKHGSGVAMEGINRAFKDLQCGKITTAMYISDVGSLSACKFVWTDILPCSGSISVFSEYLTRSRELKRFREGLLQQIDALSEHERVMLNELYTAFLSELDAVEAHWNEQRRVMNAQAYVALDDMAERLDEQLQLKFLLYEPTNRQHQLEMLRLDSRKSQEIENQHKLAYFERELNAMQLHLDSTDSSDKLTVRAQMAEVIQRKLDYLVPTRTSWDQAERFFALQ